MITPIRIGGTGLHLCNLCYWEEQAGGKLLLYFPGVPKTLEGETAAIALRYLKKHSVNLQESSYKEPTLPPNFKTESTTLLLDPTQLGRGE